MFDWLSTFRIVPEAIRAYRYAETHKRELRWDFVLEAIGLEECLSPDSHEAETISLVTIELRIRLLQESGPERADKCGIPSIGDPNREIKIKEILREMVTAGKLHRCHGVDRWKVALRAK